MLRKIMAMLLALLLLLCTACGSRKGGQNQGESNEYKPEGSINIPYCANDFINPYLSKTKVNRNLSTLMYEPLFNISSAYEVINCLAASYTLEGKVCTVKLNHASFSDGAALTADDVVYSFNLAKASENYNARLKTIVSATVLDVVTVVFECEKIDPYFVNLLTFPIIKKDSDKLTDSDNVSLPPIGTGRYIFGSDHKSLTYNPKWHGKLNVDTIRLINTPDSEALQHSVETGAIDMYYTDLSDCTILRMSGSRMNVNINNLVYLGINHNSRMLSNQYLRHAISSAIDRNKICEQAYYTNAIAATGVFNPAWEAVDKIQTIQPTAQNEMTIENLTEIGYNNKDAEGYYIDYNGNRLSVRLLVNEENAFRCAAADMLVKQLALSGIEVRLEKVSYSQYVSRLQGGAFDLYLAEINMLDNMDVTNLLCSGGSAAYGIKNGEGENSLQSVINGFYNGVNTVNDIAAAAISEMLIIPVCYKTGILFYSEKIQDCTISLSGDIYYSMDKIKLK